MKEKRQAAPSSLQTPRVSACHFGDISRRYSGSISCHCSGCRSILVLAPIQPPFWLRFKLHCGCVLGWVSLWLGFSKVPPTSTPLPVSAPQVAGLLPGTQISGRSRLRPFVWGGILPLFSHLACNLNTQNISCLTNRPRDKGAAEDKRLEAVQPHAGLMVSDWA